MSASVTSDKLTQVRDTTNPVVTTVSSPRSIGGLSLSGVSLSGWPTVTAVHFITYQKTATGAIDKTTQCDWKGIVSGTTIGTLTLKSGTDAGNAVGDFIEMAPTATWGEDLYDWGSTGHNTDGTHKVFAESSIVPTAAIEDGAVTPDKLATGVAAASVTTSETSAVQTYGDNLATVGPSVTVTIGKNGKADVHIYAKQGSNSTTSHNAFTSFVVSGANSQAASDAFALQYQVYAANASNSQGATFTLTGLTPGSTTFKMQYRVDGDTGTWANRRISVLPL